MDVPETVAVSATGSAVVPVRVVRVCDPEACRGGVCDEKSVGATCEHGL